MKPGGDATPRGAKAPRKRRSRQHVLMLPGVMGSTLGRRRKLLPDDLLWFDPIEIALGRLTDLALPQHRRLEPLGALMFGYAPLQRALERAGFAAAIHPYDWRLSVVEAGARLADRLERENLFDVAIVAHSMGGLVARAALAARGGGRIARVVQLGTPNRGAYVAVQALRGSYPLVRRIAALDLAHDAGTLARRVFATLDGLAELLPAAEACEGFDPFRAADWPAGPHPATGTLAAARQARAALASPDERCVLVAGVDRDTVTGLRRRGRELEFAHSRAGDGTVPLALAELPGLSTHYVGQEHGRLPSDARVLAALPDLIRSGRTAALPASWAAPRGARRVWRREAGPAPDRKVFWDDLAPVERLDFLREFIAAPEADVRSAGAVSGPAGRTRRAPVAPPQVARARAASSTRHRNPLTRHSRPTELRLVLGSITQARSRALVLATYDNVEPAGAASAVDALLGGAVRELTERRAFRAAAGEVLMLPVGRSALGASYVVFAGLGEFGAGGPPPHRLAAANVVRMLALCGVDDYAWVLWGTASGVDPSVAAAAQAQGLLEALADLDPATRPRRITLASRSLRRLAVAEREFGAACARSVHGSLLTVRARRAPLPAPVSSRRAAGAPTAQSYLFVSELEGALRASLLGTQPKATALAATQKLDVAALERHLEQLGDGLEPRQLTAFGSRLAELLLPAATREALQDVHDSPLVIVHDAASSRWPWETLHVDGWAPAASAGLSRRYAVEGMSVARWREGRRLERTLRLLLVVNPTADLPGADREGTRIAQALARQPDIELVTLRHGAATRARLLDEFRSGGYDAIHYAGHAFFDPHDPPASGILCAGGRVLAGEDLSSLEHLPALVFFNACESGRVRRRMRARRALEQGTGLAEAFLRGGVANFVGTWWPVSDAAAAEFAQRFYSSLASGESVGRAVQEGRAAVRGLPSPDWADYLHYGSHDFVLKSAAPRRGQRGV